MGVVCKVKILFLSDWHNYQYNLPEMEIDLLITLGDFNWRTIEALDKKYSCKKIGLLGNHDRQDAYKGTEFLHLHKTIIEYNGITIAGFDGCPKYNFKESPQFEESEVEEFTKNLDAVDLFIAHANPMIGENYDRTDAHRGFKAFTHYIQEKNPIHFVHGHNHEEKVLQIGMTKVISVYPSYLMEW